jgi:hypothetical protein
MRKWIWLIAAAPLALAAAQTIQHETKAINIEIPVRVFKGNAFVDILTLDDFEVWDNDRPQKLEAVYLIKKTNIERKEEAAIFAPDTGRHFYLIFEMAEYDPKLRPALEFFVKDVLIPGDDFVIATPMKAYRMKSEMLVKAGRGKVVDDLLSHIRRDIQMGAAEYRSVIEDIAGIAQTLTASLHVMDTATEKNMILGDPFLSSTTLYWDGVSFEEQLQVYSTCLSRLDMLRNVDEQRLLDFARALGDESGQKNVFLFYQREFIPKIDPKLLSLISTMLNDRVDIAQNLSAVFDLYYRETPLNVEFIKKAFASSTAAVHFLFVTKPAPKITGVVMEEKSEDIYASFREMARATGGYFDTSANFEFIMKSAAAALENYYLLYYTPVDYKADGSFHDLKVKVKSGGYRLTHRSGYIAD